MSTINRIDPRIRALGKARIDVTRRARDEQDFQRMWHAPRNPFPFSWGPGLKHCIQYVVEDFAAEVGFFIDVLGFPVSAFSPNYAQFTTPEEELHFGVVAAPPGAATTPPDTLRIQFAVRNLHKTIDELERRGIRFDLRPDMDESSVPYAVFRTPHGIGVELLGIIEPSPLPVAQRPLPKASEIQPPPERDLEDSLEAFWEDDFPEPGADINVPVGEPSGFSRAEASSSEALQVADDAEEALTGLQDDLVDDEIIYESVEDTDEEQDGLVDEPTYEDVEETVTPVSVLPVKPRPAPIVSSPQPLTRTRRLDINLPPARLSRSRRSRSNGPARYPTLDER
jgi:catechol 2,3-dioxygenase-like lactoylglutathione lyase family enzyme